MSQNYNLTNTRDKIIGTFDTTVKLHGDSIVQLQTIISLFKSNFVERQSVRIHISHLLKGEFVTKEGKPIPPKDIEEEFKTYLEKIVYNNKILPEIFEYLQREFDSFIIDLLCGNYESAIRTLRWIVETCVYATEFQTSQIPAKAYPEYVNDLIRDSTYRVGSIDETIENDATITYVEFYTRLEFMEKFKVPPFKDILDKIPILKNQKTQKSTERLTNRSDLRNKIIDLYNSMSKYAHYTQKSTTRSPRTRVSQGPGLFNMFMFEETYVLGIQVLDSILLLFILLDAWYYSYETVYAYIRAKKKEFKALLKIMDEHNKKGNKAFMLPKQEQLFSLTRDTIQKVLASSSKI